MNDEKVNEKKPDEDGIHETMPSWVVRTHINVPDSAMPSTSPNSHCVEFSAPVHGTHNSDSNIAATFTSLKITDSSNADDSSCPERENYSVHIPVYHNEIEHNSSCTTNSKYTSPVLNKSSGAVSKKNCSAFSAVQGIKQSPDGFVRVLPKDEKLSMKTSVVCDDPSPKTPTPPPPTPNITSENSKDRHSLSKSNVLRLDPIFSASKSGNSNSVTTAEAIVKDDLINISELGKENHDKLEHLTSSALSHEDTVRCSASDHSFPPLSPSSHAGACALACCGDYTSDKNQIICFNTKSSSYFNSYAPLSSDKSDSGSTSYNSSSISQQPVENSGVIPIDAPFIDSPSWSQGVSTSRPGTSEEQQHNAVATNGGAKSDNSLQQRPVVHNAKAQLMYNWQSTLATVKERFAFLFNNEILSDVQFVVGRGDEEQTIPAHKFVLAVGSAVFDAMFNGQLASEQQVIHLPDVEPQAFLALLSFLYSDEVQIGPETVMTVLYTAKKYAVPALESHCVDFLKNNLSSDNAFMLLTQARLFDEPQLAAMCLKTIDKCTAEAITAEGFTDIDHDTLTLVLQRDTLRIKELHLFQAVCRWAEAECVRQGFVVNGMQQREVLGEALKLIRFPLMTVEEFAQGPAQSHILTDAELVQLFLYFSVNPKPSVDFIDVPRCCMTGKEQTMCRFQGIEARWGYSGTPDRIRFIVDRRIFVVGFGMYGSIHGPSEYEITVQLIHTITGKVCGSNETVFTSDGTMNTFRVMFPDPIEVLPNTNYTAYATLKGSDSHYGTKGLRKVVVECPSGDRVCFQFSYAAGNNNGTSVEDGQIPEIIFYT